MIPAYHAGYVLDASVAVKWFSNDHEPHRDKAIALQKLHISGRSRLAAPEFFLLEMTNALWFGKRFSEQEVAEGVDLLKDLSLQLESLNWEHLHKTVAIAFAYKVSLYDAAYVGLAETLGYPLVTADEVLLKKMRGHSIVLRLKDLSLESPAS